MLYSYFFKHILELFGILWIIFFLLLSYIKKLISGTNRWKSRQSLWWASTTQLVNVFLPLLENIAVSLVFLCVLQFFILPAQFVSDISEHSIFRHFDAISLYVQEAGSYSLGLLTLLKSHSLRTELVWICFFKCLDVFQKIESYI